MTINGCAKQLNKDGVEALCISTAGINAGLPCVVKAEDIEAWGFKPHVKIRAGYWWLMSDVPQILGKVEHLIREVRAGLSAE